MITTEIPDAELTEAKRGEALPVGLKIGVSTVLVKFFFTNPKHIPPGLLDLIQEARGVNPNASRSLVEAAYDLYHEASIPTRVLNIAADSRHVATAFCGGYGERASLGRARDGRVDTGYCRMNNIERLHLGCIRRGLGNVGLKLSFAHWFWKKAEDPNKWDKYVVVLTFAEEEELSLEDLGLEGKEFPNFVEFQKAVEAAKAARKAIEPFRPTERTVEAIRKLAAVTWGFTHVWRNLDGKVTVNCNHLCPDAKPERVLRVRNHALVTEPHPRLLLEDEE